MLLSLDRILECGPFVQAHRSSDAVAPLVAAAAGSTAAGAGKHCRELGNTLAMKVRHRRFLDVADKLQQTENLDPLEQCW